MAEDKGMEPVDEGRAVVPDAPLADVPTIIPELEDVVSQLATDVSFARKTWKDGSEGATPITAAELNRLEKGVADLTNAVNALRDSVSQRLLTDMKKDQTKIALDGLTKTGIYVAFNPDNAPHAVVWSWVVCVNIVLANNEKYMVQLLWSNNPDHGIHARAKTDGLWSTWKQM